MSYLYDYGHDPYAAYAASSAALDSSPDGPLEEAKSPVIGIELGELSKAYPENLLDHPGQLEDRLGPHELLIQRDPQGRIRAFERTPRGTLRELKVVSSYWFAWLAFHPDTQLYQPSP